MYMGHDSCMCATTYLYGTWLHPRNHSSLHGETSANFNIPDVCNVTRSCVPWHGCTGNDTCANTYLYVTYLHVTWCVPWRIHTWHDICAWHYTHWYVPRDIHMWQALYVPWHIHTYVMIFIRDIILTHICQNILICDISICGVMCATTYSLKYEYVVGHITSRINMSRINMSWHISMSSM